MSVTLLRAYSGFASGALVTTDAATEAALVAQGLATYTSTGAINPVPAPSGAWVNQNPTGPFTAGTYGPAVVTNIPIGNVALTGLDGNGTALGTAFNTAITEIFVPHWNTWTGAALLNGTGLTDTYVYWLWNTEGDLLANTALAGGGPGSASVFSKLAFSVPITLSPGRYFVGFTASGTTATPRRVVAAMGAEPRCSVIATITSFAAAATTFATAITVPTTFTTAQAPIMQLYS